MSARPPAPYIINPGARRANLHDNRAMPLEPHRTGGPLITWIGVVFALMGVLLPVLAAHLVVGSWFLSAALIVAGIGLILAGMGIRARHRGMVRTGFWLAGTGALGAGVVTLVAAVVYGYAGLWFSGVTLGLVSLWLIVQGIALLITMQRT